MQEIITSFHHKARVLCKPDPKYYPDPSLQQLRWNRNILNFYALLFATVSFISFPTYLKFPLWIFYGLLGLNIFSAILFCLICRSRPWVFHFSFTTVFILGELAALEYDQETVYLHIGYAFINMTLVFLKTGEIWLTFYGVALQGFVMKMKFKEKIILCIIDAGPEAFADKLVKNILLFVVILAVVNTILVKILDKRTIELSRAKNALENALEQQKTFIFSFSHELRNPINSLLGNLQLVLQGSETLSSKTKEMINTAKVCGEILLHNINNVLDTGKHDIGKLEVNPTPTQLNELFQRTWGIYSELFRQKKLRSQLKIEKDIPSVVSIDSHKVNQILLNLIGNSIKFTEKGSVSVTVKWLKYSTISDQCFEPIPYDDTDEGLFEKEENLSVLNASRFSDSVPGFLGINDGRPSNNESQMIHNHPQREFNGILKILVKDTGSGMKKEALEKLFQKFSQVSENVSQRQIGTGLGLFITKEICNAMSGEIRAFSKFGTGTTFVACIPTTSVPMSTVQRADSESILQQLSSKHLKAIVADDSPFNVNLICDYFAKFSASVSSVAYNGYDAFTNYKECHSKNINIDVVTLDIDMPVMDGRKACDKIREFEREHKLKPTLIILISGNYDKEQIEEYLNSNKDHRADSFLRKPVSFSEFHRTVYSLVIKD